MTTSLTWNSGHDLPDAGRQPIIALLNQQLADCIDLGLQAKQAHWNVKGPHFAPLHELFDEAAETLAELADELAERAVELGGIATGTLQHVAVASRISEYDPTMLAGGDHLRALGGAVAAFARTTRAAIDTTTAAGDAVTADVFTEVSRAADKLLWTINAHGAATP